nr:sialate O-acetylesterase [Planctomycetota bacterium]
MRIDSGLLPGHVLQRAAKGATAKLVGTATASGRITATIAVAGKTVRGWARRPVGHAAYGAFNVKLAGIPVGGPYTVTLAVGDERAEVRDVWVGDLWLMAGQSNMEGCGDLADAAQPHAQVRAFSMANRWGPAREPLHHLAESPDLVHNGGTQETREQAARGKRARIKGAGVGTRFGNLMQERTGVPQGLIAVAHGGTTMEMWDPARRELGGASLYGSMLATMRAVGQPIAGVLWYQGEGDTSPEAVPHYTRRMQDFVAAVRTDLRQPKLPFVVVQIGRVIGNEGAGPNWNALQEQQRLL